MEPIKSDEISRGELGVDALLAQEMTSLERSDRNRLLESMHGVEDIAPENDLDTDDKLRALDVAIQSIPQRQAYDIATRTEFGRSFVGCRKFRLAFLRAEFFDVHKAAQRLVLYLKEKLVRFGREALVRQLTLNDLNGSAKSVLTKKGIIQLLPARDSVGRAILVCYYNDSTLRKEINDNPGCLGDALFYCLTTAAEDEETQIRGIVSYSVIASAPSNADLALLRASIFNLGMSFFGGCPTRTSAMHFWLYDKSPRAIAVLNTIRVHMGPSHRIRTLLHQGSFEECKQRLRTYGIPVDHLPFTLDGGDIRLAAHTKWLYRRRRKEANDRMRSNPSYCFEVTNLPGFQDVCLGRGTVFHQHSGNIQMRSLMEQLLDEYKVATGSKRQELNKIIVQAVRLLGGRFLAKNPCDGWFDVVTNEATITRCVGGIFRSMVSRMKAKLGGGDSGEENKNSRQAEEDDDEMV